MTTETTTAAIVKTREVPLEPEAAFRLFTDAMTTWWPFATHSVGQAEAESVRFDLELGQLIETTTSGAAHVWAAIEQWEPPSGFSLAWHPGGDASQASTLEIRFTPVAGGTAVQLTHSGWERLGTSGPTLRENYQQGWDVVLLPFTERAAQ